jgi:uncharacterized cupin superfamily protein
MNSPVINVDALTFAHHVHGDNFEARVGNASNRIGAAKLGYSVIEVPSGKCAFPFHSHYANEEAFFIIEGNGMLRYGKNEQTLRAGDFVACPVGGPATAHQIKNTGTSTLRYIGISTRIAPEICEYPDSDRLGTYPRVKRFADDSDYFGRITPVSVDTDFWEAEVEAAGADHWRGVK